MSEALGGDRTNPYVGPRSFRFDDRLWFFGRERETREVANLLTAERIVLLHSPAGAGKTSLINAAVIPRLVKTFHVHPVVRVGRQPPADATGVNRYLLSTMLSLEVEKAVGPMEATLDEFLRTNAGATAGKPELLVFDQFEEILTLDAFDRPAKREFFRQLGAALRREPLDGEEPRRPRWALIAMRDEYVAALAPYLRDLPSGIGATYRLELLDAVGAIEAIEKPAAAKGVTFEPAATRKLVADLSGIRSERSAGQSPGTNSSLPPTRTKSVEEPEGQFVEPVQVQVVCYRLWERLQKENLRHVTVADVERLADVENALAAYYAEHVARAASQGQVAERDVRVWVESQLISPEGVRTFVAQGAAGEQAMADAVVQALIDAFLVRREERRSIRYLELSHDRLIDPVRRSNAEWAVKNMHPFQLQAQLWRRQQQPVRLLLRGGALAEADIWVARYPNRLNALDREFLSASHARASPSVRFKNFAYRWWALTSTVIGVGLVAALVFTTMRTRDANRRYSEADTAQRQAKLALIDAQTDLVKAVKEREVVREKADEHMHAWEQAERARQSAETALKQAQLERRQAIDNAATINRQRHRPVRPGLSISRVDTLPATVCCVVRDSSGGKYLLGPLQTFAPPHAKAGDPIVQPALKDGGTVEGDAVAELTRWKKVDYEGRNTCVAAIARLLPGIEAHNDILGVGAILGTATVQRDDPVRAIGRTTPLVRGRVVAIDVLASAAPVGKEKIPALFAGMIAVRTDGSTTFPERGDLGGVVLTADNRIVGFVYAKGQHEGQPVTLVMPIDPILKELDVTLDRSRDEAAN